MAGIYLDSSTIIYAVEGDPELQRRVIQRLSDERAPVEVIVSRLSLLECRVKPWREKQDDVLDQYDKFFARPDLTMVEIEEVVIDVATWLRAEHGFKVPDAIHLASALTAKTDRFLTGDKQLTRCPGLRVDLIPL